MERLHHASIYLLVFLLVTITIQVSSSSSQFGKFQIHQDSFLIANVLYNLKVRSFADCVAVCLTDWNCTSINFAQLNFLCEINGEFEGELGGNVTSTPGWSHAVLIEKDELLKKTSTTTQSLTTSKGTTTIEGTTAVLTTLKEETMTSKTTTEEKTTVMTTALHTTTTVPTTTDIETTPVPEISGCGQYVTRECVVTSPGYPWETPHDLTCDITLEAPENHTVFVIVEDVWMLSVIFCTDKFKFYDGETSNHERILKVCGFDTLNTPAYFMSSGKYYLSRMETDWAVRSKGYKYSVHFIRNVCGESFNIPANGEKRIVSPGYPIGRLPGDLDCQITFTGSTALTITFTLFNLDCPDRVMIHDGPSETSSVIADLCGNSLFGPYTSSGNVMYLRLETDGEDYSIGFEAIVTEYDSS
ncbi:Cubilin [Holothuria leucospilota]|uniref:Cubilin n=1 Tax=Holothuria leucospilota TaxID=206669 RepID=A0A9Q0YQ14_HOLLE|nr:Cubilin [Holothuria leucospilota]